MSGARLCTVLGELGIGGYESFEPDSFEWPFQYEEVAPVLNWICSSLRPSNVLSPSELSQYEQLLNEGKFLEGEDLDSAFDSISAFTSKRDNQEALFGADDRVIDIREAKSAFKADALEMQKQLERQKSQFSLLACQVSSLIKGKRARVASIAAVNGQIAALDEKLSARNLEMNAVLGKIASTALELAQYHKGDENTIYLSFSDFHSYLYGDMACAKELNEWFSKQFEKGPFRLVAEEGKSNCSWVSLDDITACLKRGDSEKSYHQRVAELKRLRSIFATSERQWVEAQVENAKQQAILIMLKSQISSDEAHIHHDIHSLRRKQAELVAQLSSLHREESYLFEAIPLLCSELAQLQDTYILQGDYDLKVMRQECYINRQKVYINHLINQLARHRFIKIACQLEKKTMLGVYSLIKVIDSELQSYLSAANSRLGHYLSLIQAASEVREQGAVDDRDTFLHSVRDLLAIYSNSQALLPTYVSSHGIIQQISAVRSDLVSLQLELENSLPEDRRGCVNELCTLIQTLEQPLFASSTTAEPLLTSRPLLRELEEMDKMNSQLSVSVEEVTEAHRHKAEIVKHHPHEVGLERQVFVDFFCNPDRLRNRVRELTSRVKAMQK